MSSNLDKLQELQKLPEIPSEFIEPYLQKFMGNIIQFAASACTEEEKVKRGSGWTISEIRQWVKGVEMFVSFNCGVHARLAMQNEFYSRWNDISDEEIKRTCEKIFTEQ